MEPLKGQPPALPGETPAEYNARVYHLYDLRQLKEKAAEAAAQRYIVEHLVPTSGVIGGFGDSGLGKTPFMYQMLLCVSSGQSFLGLQVEQSPVLYLGYEDSTAHTASVIEQQMIHLGLRDLPADFHVWSVNDASPNYGVSHKFGDLVRRVRPRLVVLDPIASFFEGIEDSATNATKSVNILRALGSEVECAIFFLHHLKKAREEGGEGVVPLEEVELAQWLQRARGSNAIVSAIDTRILFGKPSTKGGELLVRGRARGQDEFPMMVLSREIDEFGDILGYDRMVGKDLVTNLEYKGVYEQLPNTFRFNDAVRITGRAKNTISLFCKSGISAGILKKGPGKYDPYVKVRHQQDGRSDKIALVTSHASDIASGLVTATNTGREHSSGTADYFVNWGNIRLKDVKLEKGERLPW